MNKREIIRYIEKNTKLLERKSKEIIKKER